MTCNPSVFIWTSEGSKSLNINILILRALSLPTYFKVMFPPPNMMKIRNNENVFFFKLSQVICFVDLCKRKRRVWVCLLIANGPSLKNEKIVSVGA